MSEASSQLDEFEWVDPRDRLLAESDALLYGNVFLESDEDGRVRRIDPERVLPVEE